MRYDIWRAALTALLSSAIPAMAEDFILSQPVDCTLGDTCYIQQYMDRDPSDGFTDFRCRALSYDGHKGTDFAVPTLADMTKGIDVLAAADGRVRGFRDGMPDTGWTDATAAEVEGRECGNGVVLVHPDGWETQYCHLRQGSVTVTQGQQVKRGTVLGQIGQSGRAEFPHLHLSVRKDGTPVDPFDPDGRLSCGGPFDETLWDTSPDYQPGGVIAAGFSSRIPAFDEVKAGTAGAAQLRPDAPALVVFGFTFGTVKGDVVHLRIEGPEGTVIDTDSMLERNHAQAFRAVGKKRRDGARWPQGTYVGEIRLIREGDVISTLETRVEVTDK